MTEPKRVLCIVSVMDAGGAETFLMKIYRKLDRSRYQMDFCVNVPEKGLYDDEIRAMGGRLYVVPCKSEDMAGFRRGLTDVVRQGGYQYVLRVTSNAIGFYDLKLAKDARTALHRPLKQFERRRRPEGMGGSATGAAFVRAVR